MYYKYHYSYIRTFHIGTLVFVLIGEAVHFVGYKCIQKAFDATNSILVNSIVSFIQSDLYHCSLNDNISGIYIGSLKTVSTLVCVKPRLHIPKPA